MTLELDDDESLVLFEWLARFDDNDARLSEDPAEELVLWRIHGQLERQLVVQFHPNYRELVESARARLREKQGTPRNETARSQPSGEERMNPDVWTLDGARVTDAVVRQRLRETIENESDLIVEHRFFRRSTAAYRFICSSAIELETYLATKVFPGDSLHFWNFEQCCHEDNVAEAGKVPDENGRTPVGGAY